MISMCIFRRLCDDCKNTKTIKHISSTDEFFDVLQKIKLLVVDGHYEYIGGNNPKETINRWSQDGLWYRIKCNRCGTIFTLWYDTFKGKGSFKKGKINIPFLVLIHIKNIVVLKGFKSI